MSKRIAVIQMVSSASVDDNLSVAEQYISAASKQGATLISLPENFAAMTLTEKDKVTISESAGDGKIQTWLGQMSRKYQVYLLGGTIPIKVPDIDKVYAASLLYNDQGEQIGRYDKIHLFDVAVDDHERYLESAAIQPGSQVVAVDTPVGRIGLTVCYDLRFAEIYRQLIIKDVDLIFVPSAFTQKTGRCHWEVLLRARAIENLVYVAAANQGGTHENNRQTYGHSMIIDPWGKVIADAGNQSGPVFADIDLKYLKQLRASFPCNQHHVLV